MAAPLDENEHGHEPSPTTDDPTQGPLHQRVPRACISCRAKKAKCRNQGGAEPGPCERCLKRGTPRECVYDVPTKTVSPEEE